MSPPASPEGVTQSEASTRKRSEAVRVWLLGGFRVSVGSRTIDEGQWRLRKAAALIKLLALSSGHRLHREQVMDILWPDSGKRAASNNLRRVLHAARNAFDPAASFRYLASHEEWLVLCPGGNLWVDVEAFEEAVATARRVTEPAAYRAAITLYAGELLPGDRYEGWAEQHSQPLRETYLSLLLGLSRTYEERAEYDSAAETLRRVVSEQTTREEAHVGLMRLYALLGSNGEALEQYGRLEEGLLRELGTEPSASSRALREEIAAGKFPPKDALSLTHSPEEALGTGKHNLPAARTSFVGREQEMLEVKRALVMTRLLTLTGAGGSGKTRLALEVARDLATSYPDGVWLVELAPLTEGALVPQVVAEALEVREQPGRSLTDTLAEALRQRDMLLILDNCEHLADPVARLLDTLLDSCPRLRVLATSRETLGVEGEAIRRVASLSVPDTDRLPVAEEMTRYDAVRLFLDRTRLRLPNFDLTAENGPVVAEVCRKLEGMPLAIELAAAKANTLTVEQISERLGSTLTLLTGGGRTAVARHRTLRGTLDWSHNLLSEPERKVFRRLSVFAGGWTLEAAEAVVPGEDAEESEMVNLLSGLADKSLVVVEMRRDGGARYRLLEPVRQYALEKLKEGGELGAIRHRHLEFFLALAEEAEPELVGAEQAEWIERLEVELDNLRAALSLAPGQGRAELGLRMGATLWRFWIMRARYGEGRKWLEAALAAESEAPLLVRAKAALVAGYLAAEQGVYMRSQPHLEEALALYQSSGSAEGVAMTLATLGRLASYRGDLERVRKLDKESFDRYRKLGDPWQFSGALRALAADLFVRVLRGLAKEAAYDEGDITRGVALQEEALMLSRRWGDSAGVALCLLGLGYLAIDHHDPERAVKLLEESLVLAREVYAGIVPHILGCLGNAALIQGDNERALTVYKEALAILRETGQEQTDTGVLEGMASLAAALENDARAARLWGAVESALQVIGATQYPQDLALYESYLDAARSRLGEAAWEAALAEGRNMALEEAIEYALSEKESATLISATPEQSSAGAQPPNLTLREKEVAILVAKQLSNRQIASQLVLSQHTVATHVRNILKKLGLKSRAQIGSWVTE